MIILDTNIVSESLKQNRSRSVMDWLDQQRGESLYLTAVSLSELTFGIEILPGGKRRRFLSDALSMLLLRFFDERILPFDKHAAIVYGALVAEARAAGKTVSVADGQIASIAKVHGCVVATRDSQPFEWLGIPVVNPWEKW